MPACGKIKGEEKVGFPDLDRHRSALYVQLALVPVPHAKVC